MSDAATPAVPNDGTPPVAPAATPAQPAANPEMVTLTKEAHDQLQKDAARGSSNQRKADLYDRMTSGKGNGHFKPTTPATPPSDDERAAAAAAEDRKAERGLLALVGDPTFREVFDADPTLRTLMSSNPLAVLPMLAPDALDAEDALNLVKEALGKRKPAPAPATPPAAPATPPAPPAGGINTPDKPVNEEVEAARKNPNTERAVAGMIGARIKSQAGKK